MQPRVISMAPKRERAAENGANSSSAISFGLGPRQLFPEKPLAPSTGSPRASRSSSAGNARSPSPMHTRSKPASNVCWGSAVA